METGVKAGGVNLFRSDIRRELGPTRCASIFINHTLTHPRGLSDLPHTMNDGSRLGREVQLDVLLTLLYGDDNL